MQQHPAVAADAVGEEPGLAHRVLVERAELLGDRDHGEDHHRRVGLVEEQVEVLLDREARPRVVLAAAALREAVHEAVDPRDPGAGTGEVVVEVVRLDVEDDLVAGERSTAASVEVVAPSGMRYVPPDRLPRERLASSWHAASVPSMSAAPPRLRRNRRRSIPSRRARTSASARVRRIASRQTASSGTGRNSVFEQGPSFTGSSASGSHAIAPTLDPWSRPEVCATGRVPAEVGTRSPDQRARAWSHPRATVGGMTEILLIALLVVVLVGAAAGTAAVVVQHRPRRGARRPGPGPDRRPHRPRGGPAAAGSARPPHRDQPGAARLRAGPGGGVARPRALADGAAVRLDAAPPRAR